MMPDDREIIRKALRRARTLGADVAGVVPATRLINCPSAVADGYQGSQRDREPTSSSASTMTRSILNSTSGKRVGNARRPDPRGIGRRLGLWLQENYRTRTEVIPYQIQDGGIYLKDAACMAGIGRMGRNNLVLVPGYGPRIRFRAVWADLTSPDQDLPGHDTPCAGCEGYCISACPMDAFATGRYSRDRCMARMDADKASGRERIDHCRACELACPVRS